MLGDQAIIVLQWNERKKQSEEKKERVVPPVVIQPGETDNTLASPIFSIKGIIDGFWKTLNIESSE